MSDAKSVSPWIKGLAAGGEPNAGTPDKLCEELFQRCVGLARKKLQGHAIGEGDGTDVAVSAFRTFFRRAKECKFSDLEDQNHLLNLLLQITAYKAADLKNYPKKKKHGGGRVAAGDVLEKEEAVKKKPDYRRPREPKQVATPALAAPSAASESEWQGILNGECRRLLDLLGDNEQPRSATLRRIAVWKLEGYTNKEIEAKLGCTRRAVERKVDLIKNYWAGELNS